jgi:hypothetical protein
LLGSVKISTFALAGDVTATNAATNKLDTMVLHGVTVGLLL